MMHIPANYSVLVVRRTPGVRRAFTLIELLVVMTIIAALAALIAAGIMSWTSGQARRNSETTIRSVHNTLMRHWDTVVSDAKKETNLPAGIDRTTWIKLRLMEAFPVTYAEVNANGLYATAPLSSIPSGKRRYAANYRAILSQKLVAANHSTTTTKTESAACLLLALSLDRGGGAFVPDSAQSFIKDTDNDGLPEFVDGWGEPLYFYRFASIPDLDAQYTPGLTNTLGVGFTPMIASSGPDLTLGLSLPLASAQNTQTLSPGASTEADNLYSYKINK